MATTGGARRYGALVALLGLFAALQLSSGALVETLFTKKHIELLGGHQCTYGPSFWCQNLTNAASCKAVKHCIQTTWVTQKYPEDSDDICTICKNMVKEARDTLQSNVTLDELKQVFYGSCQLLPLKVIKNECKKLADEFIPELVDTLASEMDPNVVCTVSGLCNNERIDKLLLENKADEKVDGDYHLCEQCSIAMDKGERLVQEMSHNEVIQKVLLMCGELSSYSDACSSIVLSYQNQIYNAVKNDFTKSNICMLSGMCSEAFHPHADGYEKSRNALMGVEISNAGERGRIQIQKPLEVSDDTTCDFCETLVKHLRDIMIANTTEEQFSDVLKGLCKQTGSFKDECLALVSENYARIYQFLVGELNGKVLCTIVGICPKSLGSPNDFNYGIPMYPLLPVELLRTLETEKVMKEESKQKPTLVMVDEQPPKVKDITKPVSKSPVIDVFSNDEHFVVNDVDMPMDKTVCFLCQSVLNYVQQEVTDPKVETDIRAAVEKSCSVLPSSFKDQCKQFVDQYGDAFIALIAQEVDPSIICPELKLCPSTDLSLTSNKDSESSNSCPLCVVFMSTLESEITNKDTEEVMKKKLEKLCTKLPSQWKTQCTNFVSTELQSILDMLVAQVKPEEICILLEVCKPKISKFGDVDTNMVASTGQVTIVFPGFNMGTLLANNYKMLEESPKVPTPACVVCLVVMKYLNKMVQDKSTQDEIEHVLDSTCSVLPNVEEKECQAFIDTHYQQIIFAIQLGTDPKIACLTLMVCEDDQGLTVENEHHLEMVKKSQLPTVTDVIELDRSEECAACEAFAKVFDSQVINSSADLEEIDVTDLCSKVEVVYKDQIDGDLLNLLRYGCDSRFEDQNSNWLIKSLLKIMQTNCTHHCANRVKQVGKFHPKCTLCKDVIHDIKQKIENSPAEKDIKYRLEGLCDALPVKDKCIHFVEQYTDKFINTVIDDIKEESVCKEIGYC